MGISTFHVAFVFITMRAMLLVASLVSVVIFTGCSDDKPKVLTPNEFADQSTEFIEKWLNDPTFVMSRETSELFDRSYENMSNEDRVNSMTRLLMNLKQKSLLDKIMQHPGFITAMADPTVQSVAQLFDDLKNGSQEAAEIAARKIAKTAIEMIEKMRRGIQQHQV